MCKMSASKSITQGVPRHEDPGDAAPGHPTHAGKCPPPLLLCLLHLRNHGGPDVGWAAQAEMLYQRTLPAKSDAPARIQRVRCHGRHKIISNFINFRIPSVYYKLEDDELMSG